MTWFTETDHTYSMPADWVRNIFVIHENKHGYLAKLISCLTNLLLLILKLFSEIIIIIIIIIIITLQ